MLNDAYPNLNHFGFQRTYTQGILRIIIWMDQ